MGLKLALLAGRPFPALPESACHQASSVWTVYTKGVAKGGREAGRRTRASAATSLPVSSLRSSGPLATLLVLVVSAIVVLSPNLRILADQQQEIAFLEAQLRESQEQVVELAEQRERWKDPAYVETQARERLLFVYPGDITYLVIDDENIRSELDREEVSAELEEFISDWRSSLLSSFLVAATTTLGYEEEIIGGPLENSGS